MRFSIKKIYMYVCVVNFNDNNKKIHFCKSQIIVVNKNKTIAKMIYHKKNSQ